MQTQTAAKVGRGVPAPHCLGSNCLSLCSRHQVARLITDSAATVHERQPNANVILLRRDGAGSNIYLFVKLNVGAVWLPSGTLEVYTYAPLRARNDRRGARGNRIQLRCAQVHLVATNVPLSLHQHHTGACL